MLNLPPGTRALIFKLSRREAVKDFLEGHLRRRPSPKPADHGLYVSLRLSDDKTMRIWRHEDTSTVSVQTRGGYMFLKVEGFRCRVTIVGLKEVSDSTLSGGVTTIFSPGG